jgi:XRE family transcriptional regulator, fatty acid utilization regulator
MARPTITLNIDALREARRIEGISQETLARLVEVSPGMIGLIETGRRQPSEALLRRIAVAVQTPIDELADIVEAGAA